jgi:hypothetical protein
VKSMPTRKTLYSVLLLIGAIVLAFSLVTTGQAQTQNLSLGLGINKIRQASQLPTAVQTYNLLVPTNTSQLIVELDNISITNVQYGITFGESANDTSGNLLTPTTMPCSKLSQSGAVTPAISGVFTNQLLNGPSMDRYSCPVPPSHRLFISVSANTLTTDSVSIYVNVDSGHIAWLPVQSPGGNAYTHISTATSTQVKSSAGTLHNLTVNTTAAGTISIFDNTACSGTTIAILPASVAVGTYTYDVVFTVGLCVLTGAASDVTVSSR